MIDVLITDDHMIVREGLRQIVGETGDIRVAAEAATASEALDRLRELAIDVVVLDLNLPDRHGVDLLAHIQSMYPRIPVLILTVHREAEYAIRLMKAGASGYVSKDAAREQLVEAIRAVSRGEKYIESEIAKSVALRMVSTGDEPAHERLTDREFQIMLLIAAGKPPREIASELGLSVRTVGAHRAKIIEKTGLPNNAAIVQYALKHRLI